MFARPTTELRRELLALKGIGPETADAILLYAGGHPVFVVDAYTRRMLARHGMLPLTANYEAARSLVEQIIVAKYPAARYPAAKYPDDLAGHYNELHALVVSVGKQHCGPTPKCTGCPLQRFLPSER
jgi:endonuclease-3 related protein